MQDTKGIPSTVGIVRREGDESAVGQFGGEALVIAEGPIIRVPRDHVVRHPLETMLANDNGAFFDFTDALWHEQVAPGENILPNIKCHLVANPFMGFHNLPAEWVDGQIGCRKLADDLFPHFFPKRFALGVPLVGFFIGQFFPKTVSAVIFRESQQLLRVRNQLLNLSILSGWWRLDVRAFWRWFVVRPILFGDGLRR